SLASIPLGILWLIVGTPHAVHADGYSQIPSLPCRTNILSAADTNAAGTVATAELVLRITVAVSNLQPNIHLRLIADRNLPIADPFSLHHPVTAGAGIYVGSLPGTIFRTDGFPIVNGITCFQVRMYLQRNTGNILCLCQSWKGHDRAGSNRGQQKTHMTFPVLHRLPPPQGTSPDAFLSLLL